MIASILINPKYTIVSHEAQRRVHSDHEIDHLHLSNDIGLINKKVFPFH